MNVIEVKDLSFVYGVGTPFEKKAVDNLSLSIKQGEVIGLISSISTPCCSRQRAGFCWTGRISTRTNTRGAT